jgi:hypothetical protein
MGERITKVSHFSPNYKTAQWSSNHRNTDSTNHSADKEIIKHLN